jgi:hypothetical protein
MLGSIMPMELVTLHPVSLRAVIKMLDVPVYQELCMVNKKIIFFFIFFLFRNLNESSTTKVIFCDSSNFSVSSSTKYIGYQKFIIQGTNSTTLRFSGSSYSYFFSLDQQNSSFEIRNV